jgi:hypothetical protein
MRNVATKRSVRGCSICNIRGRVTPIFVTFDTGDDVNGSFISSGAGFGIGLRGGEFGAIFYCAGVQNIDIFSYLLPVSRS